MPLGSTLLGLVVFAGGLAILWIGLSLIAKPLSLPLFVLVAACTMAVLSALFVAMLALGYGMAWFGAGFLGILLFKYGPASSSPTRLRILLSGFSAVFVASLVSGANKPLEGFLGVVPALVFWFSLAAYRPSSRGATWLWRAAYSAMVLYAGSAYVALHSGLAMTMKGCFWEVRFPFGYWLRLPHPYDFYITNQLTKYLFLGSLLLTVVFSIACLCKWYADCHHVKDLAHDKPS